MHERAADPARRAIGEVIGVTAAVTGLVTLASMRLVPERYVATFVGFVFLLATWILVWRKDDGRVVAFGVSLGGLVVPGAGRPGEIVRHAARAVGWAALACAVTFVPFFFGWRAWWRPTMHFSLRIPWYELGNEALGQLVIIALPEEAFYRGYVHSRLDQAMAPRVRVLGAEVGWAIVITSVLFALGHFATIREPARLAVFFPSLLFGWLRARTGGVGASVVFHAACNVFSELLGRGYGAY